MFQNDYVLRLIERMGAFLRRIKELLDEKEKEKLLNDTCLCRCGMAFEKLASLSSDTLINLLPEEACLFASELLYIRCAAFDDYDREDLRLKCLRLLLAQRDCPSICGQRSPRVIELEHALLSRLDAEDLMNCAVFLANGGAYSECEDAVFRSVEYAAPGEQRVYIPKGMEILAQAATADAQDLALCGLTKAELFESVNELKNKLNP